MSKKNKKRKHNKNRKFTTEKKKSNKKLAFVLTAIAAFLIAAIIAFLIIFFNSSGDEELHGRWLSVSANNASGDEVDMSEVYQTYYSNYHGSMEFKDDGTFSLWISPGDSEDGTHSGTYSLPDAETIEAAFDEGTVTHFKINRSDDKISSIVINYNDYEVYFVKE